MLLPRWPTIEWLIPSWKLTFVGSRSSESIGWLLGVRFDEIAKFEVLSEIVAGMACPLYPENVEDIDFIFDEVYLNKWPF